MNNLREIAEVAKDLELPRESVVQYGRWTAKIPLDTGGLTRDHKGKLILVTAITPTPHGEGKTVTSIGLAMGLCTIGHKAVVCIRQPSLGPTLGVKGGGAGGGRAKLEPMEEINMRLTGDIDAVGAAHNLLAAAVDNHVFQGNTLGIDVNSIVWPRVVDMNDRALREITVGLGGKNGVPHQGSFAITAASEVMAILCLSDDYAELKKRLGEIIVGYSLQGKAIRARDLRCVGAMAALLKDAMQPNLVQTSEGTPAIVHGGPFGNIAHGTCSIRSMRLGLSSAEYCVVEAGFGTELGAEKFIDIVARKAGLTVHGAILVVTIKALRYHGGGNVEEPDIDAVRRGLANLERHLENVQNLALKVVVAINKFPADSEEETRLVLDLCKARGVPCVTSDVFSEGSKGSIELARRAVEMATGEGGVPIYGLDQSLEQKIESVVKRMYGGREVLYTEAAQTDIDRLRGLGLSNLPICVAKTAFSLSDDAKKLGRPENFAVSVRAVRPSAGAGFNVVYMGDILTMPGLSKSPAAERIDLADDGTVTGVF